MTQPRSIQLFSLLLLGAAAIDLVNNIVNLIGAGADFPAPRWMLWAMSVVPPLLALLLWFFVARRRSVVAKWILVALVAFGTSMCVLATVRGDPVVGTPAYVVTVVSEALKLAAALLLFRADARRWLARA